MASIVKRSTSRGLRYDVRYRLATGQVRTKTFQNQRDAKTYAATVDADRARGTLLDPRAGRVTLDAYVSDWIESNVDLRPRTVDQYRSVHRLHIAPVLGRVDLAQIDAASVRAWHAGLVRSGVGAATVAKAYRFLRAVLNTAVEDGRILANPCQIKRAGVERAEERPVATPAEVLALANAVASERRCMVLLAGFCGLRLGEVLGLANRHVDLLHGTVTVERQLQEIGRNGAQVFSEPKTAKGRRTVPLPGTVATALRFHLENHSAGGGPDGLLFTGAKGGPLRRAVWNTEWATARAAVGLGSLRYHDLRHSALTLLAASGATIAELQAHAGHASPAAAMRYQHATHDRAQVLAELVQRAIASDVEAAEAGSTLTQLAMS